MKNIIVFSWKIWKFASMKKTLISIVGTTGIGKTALSIALAQELKTEIVSCDSRQFFKEMKIGTAMPSEEELSIVPHHFIGNISVEDYYSIGMYEKEALGKIEEIFQTQNTCILVGGSMMYEKALIQGLNNLPEANEQNQAKLNKILQEKGLEELQNILQDIDYEYYKKVDIKNPRRLLRAIDVIWQTGRAYSEIVSEPYYKRSFEVLRIGIQAPREEIYNRINARVDKMMQAGLLEEVIGLSHFNRSLVALNTVGYKELFEYLDGKISLEEAVEKIKMNTRRFAKRQLTWYRKEENIHWVGYENAQKESLYLLKNYL